MMLEIKHFCLKRNIGKVFSKYKSNHWQIAYRCNPGKNFTLVQNPEWGWCADPFLVKYQGEVYLVAEIFLYSSERNGVVGYCKFEGEKFGEWKVTMDRPWHLSYPNVFVINDHLYMCPESYQLEEIAIYELQEFPDKWKKVNTIIQNKKCVDTTFLKWNNEIYMYTFEPLFRDFEGNLLLYKLETDASVFVETISKDKRGARPAGKIIYVEGKHYRVGQISGKEYGEGLALYEIKSVFPKYEEAEVATLYPKHLGKKFQKFDGIHTYNRLDGIEVIDLKKKKLIFREQIARKRVRKVFTNKY